MTRFKLTFIAPWLCLTIVGCASKELVVHSKPADANVYIKGFDRNYFPEDKVLIGTTPLKTKDFSWTDKEGHRKTVSFNEINGKEFYVLVEKQDFETVSQEAPPLYHNIRLPAYMKPLEAKNEVDKSTSKVRITSTPEGAKVYVDGEFTGNTPYELVRTPGKYQVRISRADHQDAAETITLVGNEVRVLHFQLADSSTEKKSVSPSSIKLTSSPSGAEVFVNGELVGNTPYELVRKPASYKVRVQHANYQSKEETMSVVEGESHPIHVQLEKMEEAVASVRASSAGMTQAQVPSTQAP